MDITVSWWTVAIVLGLAACGFLVVCWATAAGLRLTWNWIRYEHWWGAGWWRWWPDRVAPLLKDDRIVAGKCETCWAENGGEGCDWAMCGCACHDWEELPPERTWEQMTSHQLPLAADWDQRCYNPCKHDPLHSTARCGPCHLLWPQFAEARERRPPWWEAEQRQAYAALDLEYPSGLMARVRELGP